MKLYLQCNMGASGNMFMAALYELLSDKSAFIEKMNQLDLPGVVIEYNDSVKCGIAGTHISIKIDGYEDISDDVQSAKKHEHGHTRRKHDHEHRHGGRRYGYKEIIEIITSLDLPDKVKDDATKVFNIIGDAEASVHGSSLDDIHFHEVGSIDAVLDVVGCSLLVDMLGVTDIAASPVNVGFGMVRCEHGVLPIPAPATAEILKGIPVYSGHIEGELCTPTGAALLKHFAKSFKEMPHVKVKKIGYGMGTKNFEAANCLRAFLYEDGTQEKQGDGSSALFSPDTNFLPDSEKQSKRTAPLLCEITCNLDDMTPEAIGAAFDVLLENGALDVYTTPIMMKKNRPATMLSCLCTEESHDALAKLMITHTTTLGVRTTTYNRMIMERTTSTIQTEYGSVRIKQAQGFGTTKQKPEYDDVLAAAKKHNVPFQTVYDAVKREL